MLNSPEGPQPDAESKAMMLLLGSFCAGSLPILMIGLVAVMTLQRHMALLTAVGFAVAGIAVVQLLKKTGHATSERWMYVQYGMAMAIVILLGV